MTAWRPWRIPAALFAAALAISCGEKPEALPAASASVPVATAEANGAGEPSVLWGRNGEAWSPDSRLPDFSHAGYRSGEAEIPSPPVRANVRDYGATGDGVTDDSQAFLDAIAAVSDGALFVPAGRYRITRVLEITRSNVVLRGAGRGQTVLFFPKPLAEVVEEKGPFGGTTGWTWGGAFVRALEVTEFPDPVSAIREPARRGDRRLVLESAAGIEAGQRLRLVQYETDGSLSLHLHAGHPLKGLCMVDRPGHRSVDWMFRVAAVEGDAVILDRPLRIDVRPEWQAAVLPFVPLVEEVGIEHLTIEFPETLYPGHHKEHGYNAISLRGVSNSWVQDVEIVNADNAVMFWYSRYSTARDILVRGRGGHYSLYFGGAQDGLMTDFRLANVSEHDLSVAVLANGNVFSRGSGVQINFDHHRLAPYENLFSDIDVGESWRWARIWRCSDTPTGHYTAARETFWNIRPRIKMRSVPLWPQINVIGPFRGLKRAQTGELDAWLEPVEQLEPADLHAAQRARRLAGDG